MSYARMTEAEKRLEAEMTRLFEEAQNVDAAEDALTIRARGGEGRLPKLLTYC